jgi:DnaJ-class molecular chaperone
MDTDNKECPDCNGGGLVKGSNEYEWETYLEPCETCNGDGYVADQWAIKA